MNEEIEQYKSELIQGIQQLKNHVVVIKDKALNILEHQDTKETVFDTIVNVGLLFKDNSDVYIESSIYKLKIDTNLRSIIISNLNTMHPVLEMKIEKDRYVEIDLEDESTLTFTTKKLRNDQLITVNNDMANYPIINLKANTTDSDTNNVWIECIPFIDYMGDAITIGTYNTDNRTFTSIMMEATLDVEKLSQPDCKEKLYNLLCNSKELKAIIDTSVFDYITLDRGEYSVEVTMDNVDDPTDKRRFNIVNLAKYDYIKLVSKESAIIRNIENPYQPINVELNNLIEAFKNNDYEKGKEAYSKFTELTQTSNKYINLLYTHFSVIIIEKNGSLSEITLDRLQTLIENANGLFTQLLYNEEHETENKETE